MSRILWVGPDGAAFKGAASALGPDLQERPQDHDPQKKTEDYAVNGASRRSQRVVLALADGFRFLNARQQFNWRTEGKQAFPGNRAVYLAHLKPSLAETATRAWAQTLKKKLR
jgi:hypothetical protein